MSHNPWVMRRLGFATPRSEPRSVGRTGYGVASTAVQVETVTMRDVTVPRSFPESRASLLVSIVVSVLVFGGAIGLLIYGLIAHWPTAGLVVISVLVVVFGAGVAIRIWVYVRLKSQYASVRRAEQDAR